MGETWGACQSCARQRSISTKEDAEKYGRQVTPNGCLSARSQPVGKRLCYGCSSTLTGGWSFSHSLMASLWLRLHRILTNEPKMRSHRLLFLKAV